MGKGRCKYVRKDKMHSLEIVAGIYPHVLLCLKVIVLDMILIEFSYYLRVKFNLNLLGS